jgi:hypothetical protein
MFKRRNEFNGKTPQNSHYIFASGEGVSEGGRQGGKEERKQGGRQGGTQQQTDLREGGREAGSHSSSQAEAPCRRTQWAGVAALSHFMPLRLSGLVSSNLPPAAPAARHLQSTL